MKKLLLYCLVLTLNTSLINLYAQNPDTLICYDKAVPKISFKGKAPAIWRIDGSAKDWKTILGPYTGDNHMPYYPPRTSGFNWARDGWTPEQGYGMPPYPDRDKPAPDRDLIFDAFTNDDYNVYFYFRRLDNKNSTNSFFYFCDVNADGFMKFGEPVFYGSFDSGSILSLSVGMFIPDTTRGDPENPQPPYVPGKGNDMSKNLFLDYYHMPGKVKKLFSANNIPEPISLKKNEVFSGAVTENGYGVEFAVPWRYFRDWFSLNRSLKSADVFAYRISIQKGDDEYNKLNVVDDANNCCNSLAVSENAKVSNVVSVNELDPGFSYKFIITYTNPTNAAERVGIEDIVLTDLQYTSDKRPFYKKIKLKVSSDFDCNNIPDTVSEGFTADFNPRSADDTNTINFKKSLNFKLEGFGPAVYVQPSEKACFITHLSVPVEMSLLNSNITFNASLNYLLHSIVDLCNGAGGRTINPIGKAKTTIGGKGIVSDSSVNKNIADNLSDYDVKIYPNPSNGTATISLPLNENNWEANIYDVFGRAIHNGILLIHALLK